MQEDYLTISYICDGDGIDRTTAGGINRIDAVVVYGRDRVASY